MTLMSESFSANLRSLCAERGNISQVCREIGLNRQQFNRYLNGESLPSAHNLRRIARYFDLPEAQLFAPRTEFEETLKDSIVRRKETPASLFVKPYSDQVKNLRRYVGFYHSFFCTPSWQGRIFCSLIRLKEVDGVVTIRSHENATSPDKSVRQISRYEGLVALRGNRIFATEHECGKEGSIAQTILYSAHRQQLKYLRGMTMGVAWRPFPHPYAAKTIWKRLDERITAREALTACGVYSEQSKSIDLAVRKYLLGSGDAHFSAIPTELAN